MRQAALTPALDSCTQGGLHPARSQQAPRRGLGLPHCMVPGGAGWRLHSSCVRCGVGTVDCICNSHAWLPLNLQSTCSKMREHHLPDTWQGSVVLMRCRRAHCRQRGPPPVGAWRRWLGLRLQEHPDAGVQPAQPPGVCRLGARRAISCISTSTSCYTAPHHRTGFRRCCCAPL